MRKKISSKVKKEVLEDQKHKCADCSNDLTPKITHFDHLLPLSEGGDNDLENIQALCPRCHSIKSHTEHKKRMMRKRKEKTEQENPISKGLGFSNIDSPDFEMPDFDLRI